MFKNTFKSPALLFNLATPTGADVSMEQDQTVEGQARVSVILARHIWKPPPPGYFKVNIDAAYIQEKGRMGIGIVVRDHRGDVHVVLAAPKSAVKSIFVAESCALLRATILCNELGLVQMEFEGDAQQVVEAVNSNSADTSWEGQVVEDIKIIMSSHKYWSLQYMGRGGNKAADAATKIGLSLFSEIVWIEEVPDGVLPFIAIDKSYVG